VIAAIGIQKEKRFRENQTRDIKEISCQSFLRETKKI